MAVSKRRSLTPKSPGRTLAQKYRISMRHILGQGGFGTVYEGLDITRDTEVAIKVFAGTDNSLATFYSSIHIWTNIQLHSSTNKCQQFGRTVSCNNLLVIDELKKSLASDDELRLNQLVTHLDIRRCFAEIVEYSRDEDGEPGRDPESGLLFIVYEKGGTSLEKELEARHSGAEQQMDGQELLDLLWSLVCLTWGLHVCGYVHMDIKPANIIKFPSQPGENGGVRWKLIDLDGAVCTNETIALKDCCVTHVFMPPEIAKCMAEDRATAVTSRKMDVWSVAMCVMQAIFSVPILEPWYKQWQGETGDDTKFLKWLGDYTAEPIICGDMEQHICDIDPRLGALLKFMLSKDPESRPCIARCMTDLAFRKHRARLLEADKGLLEVIAEVHADRGIGEHRKSTACVTM